MCHYEQVCFSMSILLKNLFLGVLRLPYYLQEYWIWCPFGWLCVSKRYHSWMVLELVWFNFKGKISLSKELPIASWKSPPPPPQNPLSFKINSQQANLGNLFLVFSQFILKTRNALIPIIFPTQFNTDSARVLHPCK